MLSNTLSDHKKAMSEIKSIFTFTEIRQKRVLPNVKSFSGLKSQKSILNSTQSTWRDFLKSKKNSGNLSPRQVTPSTKELFEKVEEKAKQ
jgi:hypothetical protein